MPLTKYDQALAGLAVLGLVAGASYVPNPFKEHGQQPPQPHKEPPQEPPQEPSSKGERWKEMEDIAFTMLSEDRNGFKYDFHDCTRNVEKGLMICVACYTHSEFNYLGQQSLACDIRSCTRLHLAVDLKMHVADLSYCERENQKRVK